ncbi:MAG: outer membrane protein assembly factor BamC [Gammaproteobacteria bacterium]|nr:outer membrane protein assembly factor BamC [Gammaproteobacteria bacterium]
MPRITIGYIVLLATLAACSSDGPSKEYQKSRVEAVPRVPADLDRPAQATAYRPEALSEDAIQSLKPAELMVPPRLEHVAGEAHNDNARNAKVIAQQKQDANGVVYLEIAMRYDLAWRNVRLALMSSGFTLTDVNRSAGLFYIRYRDPKADDEQRENYTLNLLEVGSSSRLLVRSEDGQMLGDESAQRILNFIKNNL